MFDYLALHDKRKKGITALKPRGQQYIAANVYHAERDGLFRDDKREHVRGSFYNDDYIETKILRRLREFGDSGYPKIAENFLYGDWYMVTVALTPGSKKEKVFREFGFRFLSRT